MPTEAEIEQEIQDKGLTAPRLDPSDIDAVISYAEYVRIPNTTCTVCALILTNGYVVTGESAAASMENFDMEVGEKVAYTNAREKIWALEGYLLKEKLYNERKPN